MYTELQGQPGIPTVLGYEKRPRCIMIIRKKCPKELPESLTVHQMAEQLLRALHNVHRQGLVHRNLNPRCVEWDGDKILVCARNY